jgi:HK97 family phage portal protein
MDLLGQLLRAEEDYGPGGDFWYQPVGEITAAGVRLTADGAKRLSAWFLGRDILATTLAMLPLDVFERLPNDGGRGDADNHPLYDVIHRKPNPWQDSFTWRRQMQYSLIDEGNAYNRIVGGARGFVHELWPLPPSCVKPKLLSNGTKIFEVRDPNTRQQQVLTQDEVFHLHINSDDGISGKGILTHARHSLGLNIQLENFAGRIFSRGSLSAGAIEVPATLTPDVSKRMAESFARSSSEWHLPKVLENGAKWVAGQGMTPENAQMLLSRKFGITEMSRWLGVAPHMLFELDRSTNNNIEHQGQEFIDYSMGRWLSLWEFGINDQLIARPERFYAEFNRNAIVRGDIATRWAAYVDAITTGTYTRNEVRVRENMKKLPGLDEPLNPAHITGNQPPPDSASGARGRSRQSSPQQEDQSQAIAVAAAQRLLRKEVKAMQRYAVQHASDGDAFATAVTAFYHAHAELVASTLRMPEAAALRYCAGQSAQMINSGVHALDAWTTDHYARGLVELAMEAA